MLNQGFTLTLVGMSAVFSFLILLVFIMSLSSIIIPRFFPEKKIAEPPKRDSKGEIEIAIAVAASAAKKKGLIL